MKQNHKDFRCGNLVEFEGEVYEIDSISSVFPTLNTHKFGVGVVDWDNIKPIELTEEWLAKLGLEKEDNHWSVLDPMLRFAIIEGRLHCSIGHDDFGIVYQVIDYVHQLQNLFHSLTTEELTLTNDN